MALSALDYPTDIRWERVCVSRDMVDPVGCDEAAPPRWQSSVAIFRYVPDEEYQLYPERRIVYYKITCTITGYQPQSEEVAGAIDWTGLSTREIQDYENALTEPLPCHGAIVQVTVVPPARTDLDDYPYFLDFQPKQRLLYEQVSETGEHASRSVETLNVRKGAGATQSTELLDIDQGFSAGAQGSYAGTGGGFNVSHTGQWGTRQMGEAESNTIRTVDGSREARDSLSHTTQLSQMYTLFQAYHLGTNRALFFLAPRPHPQEEASGFFRSPRRLDGVQEIFLVVSQPEKQEFPCISVRLDTSHLTTKTQYGFEHKPADAPVDATAVTPVPTKENTTFVGVSSDLLYDIREIRVADSDVFNAPSGYLVESTTDTDATMTPFSTSRVDVANDHRTVTVAGEAVGRGEFRNTAGDIANQAALTSGGTAIGGPIGTIVGTIAGLAGADVFPDTRNITIGSFLRRIRIDLVSEQPTVKLGEQTVLLLTSRAICCCPERKHIDHGGPKIVGLQAFDHPAYALRASGAPVPPHEEVPPMAPGELEAAMAEGTRRLSLSVDRVSEAPALDSAFVLGRLTDAALARAGAAALTEAPPGLSGQRLRRTAEMLGKSPDAVTRADVLAAPGIVAAGAKVSGHGLLRLQLESLGVPTAATRREPAQPARKSSARARKTGPARARRRRGS